MASATLGCEVWFAVGFPVELAVCLPMLLAASLGEDASQAQLPVDAEVSANNGAGRASATLGCDVRFGVELALWLLVVLATSHGEDDSQPRVDVGVSSNSGG